MWFGLQSLFLDVARSVPRETEFAQYTVDRYACVMCHWHDDCVHGLDRFACVMCHWLDDCVHGPDGPWF